MKITIGGYHFDVIAGLAYLSTPAFVSAFAIFGHKWLLIAAAVSIVAGAIRASIVAQDNAPRSLPEGTPVTNGTKQPVGVVTAQGIQPLEKGTK